MDFIKKLLYFFVIIFCFSSCKNKAADFNDNLVNIQKNVLNEVQDFGRKMSSISVDSLPLYNVKPETEKITLFISNKINEAQNLVVPKDGENLKQAILTQLQFEKDIVIKIGRLAEPDISEDEKMQIETDFLSSQKKAAALEANVRAAQETFAKQYKFKLENK